MADVYAKIKVVWKADINYIAIVKLRKHFISNDDLQQELEDLVLCHFSVRPFVSTQL